jgi:glycosyltransferase involved in cell wall biosynthesis
MNWPRITVVTPSYNQARFLEATLASVVQQAYPDLEYIVMDGGSTDGSADIIRRYADKLAYWTSQRDGGQTDAVQKGFERGTGDILCWLNSDDLFEPWTLREAAEFFVNHPGARAIYGDATWVDIDGRPIRPKKEHAFNEFIWLFDHNFIPQPSTFWRRDLYQEVGGLNPEFDLSMDADLWIRFAQVTHIYHVSRLWSRMRFYPEQKNQRLRARCLAEDLSIRRRYLGERRSWYVERLLARSMRVAWKLAGGCYW